MNHDSGFIIGIARKFCKNPNRTLTKFVFKNMLVSFNFHEKPVRASFSIV